MKIAYFFISMDTTQLPHDLLGLSAVGLLLGLRHGFDAAPPWQACS